MTSGLEAAIAHLAVWGPEVVEPLRERLSNPMRKCAGGQCAGWRKSTTHACRVLLVGALSDPDKGVRWCAGLALRTHPSEHAAPTLLNIIIR